MTEKTCPHHVPMRQWYFREELPMAQSAQYRVIAVLNAESCPDCLRERVRNLRIAIRLLMEGSTPSTESTEKRSAAERGIDLFHADLKEWFGP